MDSKEADKLIKKAQTKLDPGFFSKLFSSENERMDKAKDYYIKAGNIYKINKEWEKAANAFLKATECEKDFLDISNYVEAGNCMKRVNLSESVTIMKKGIDACLKTGNIRMAAKHAKTVAEWYENDNEFELACPFYLTAAEYFLTDNADSTSYGCSIKAADLIILVKPDKYVDAIKIYQEIAMKYLKVPLLKSSAKDLAFKAGLLYLSLEDLVGAQKLIDNFKEEDPYFDGSKEAIFLEEIIKSMDKRDINVLNAAIHEYIKIIPLDKVKTRIVAKIKEKIAPKPEEEKESFA